jgi:hypothetical protein
MKFFDFFDKLNKDFPIENKPVIEKPKKARHKIDDMKEYKRLWYLINIETVRQRNKEYRERMKANRLQAIIDEKVQSNNYTLIPV